MALFSFGRPEAGAVLRHGAPHRGHITGIRVSHSRDDPPQRIDEFAVAVATSEGIRIYGIRQRLRPEQPIRLGLPVLLRIDGKAAIIDWPGTCSQFGSAGENVTDGWKPLKEPPHEGVVDPLLDLDRAQRKGEPARVSICALDERIFFDPQSPVDLHLLVRIGDRRPYDTVLEAVRVPFYASHLCEQGAELPAFVRLDRPGCVAIDWPIAARAFMAVEAARRG